MSAIAGTVVPVFGSVAVGYALARRGLFDGTVGHALVRFTYHLAIPAMLLRSVASAELPATLPWRLLLSFYLPSLMLFALAAVASRRALGWRPGEGGVAGMTAAYANLVLLGYPLVVSAFGQAGLVPLFMLLAVQAPVLLSLATWLLERRARSAGAGGPRGTTWRALFANPIVMSLLAGLVLALLQAPLPAMLDRLLATLGSAGPGCALVALGVSLAAQGGGAEHRGVFLLAVAKTVLHPLLVWGCGRALALRPDWLAVAVLLAAMPSGVNAYVVAARYGVREALVARCVLLSTVASCAIVSVLLAVLPGVPR